MRGVARGALLGAAYGLAVAAFEGGMELLRMFFRPTPPAMEHVAQAAVLEIAALALLGAVLSPLLRLGRGVLWHALAMAALWQALETASAIASPPVRTGVGPVLGLLLYGLAILVGRRRPRLAPALAVVLLLAGIFVPEAYARWRAPSPPPLASAPPAGAPDVVLIVLDTVRAQNMSAYGYALETTPNFDALAAEGTLFLDATAPGTWSPPSHGSLFTGLFPSVHGAHGENPYLADTMPTLAELLAGAGYDTRSFTANPWISDHVGLNRGFRWSDEAWREGSTRSFHFLFRLIDYLGFGPQDKGGALVVDNFEAWLADRPQGDRPAFVFMNFLEAHFPYHQIPEPFLREFTEAPYDEMRRIGYAFQSAEFGGDSPDADTLETALAMYDAGIRYTDHLLGRVVAALRAADRLDRTLLVVLADHGELVGDHGGYGHGSSLHELGIRVPLLIRYPARIPGGTRVAEPVSTVGVLATICELLELEVPPVHVGSLLPVLEGRPAGMPVLSERFASPREMEVVHPLLRPDLRFRSYRVGQEKIIEASDGSIWLFDLASDPGETRDLAAANPEAVARLRAELDTWGNALGLPGLDEPLETGTARDMDPAARERLKALGYLD